MTRKVLGRPGRFQVFVCALTVASLTFAAEKDGVAAAEAAGNSTAKAAVSDSSSETANEIIELKKLLLNQQRQIDEMRRAIAERKGEATPSQAAAPATTPFRKLGEVGSTTPMIPPVPPEPPATSAIALPQAAEKGADAPAPLNLRIGDTYITPIGFMDFTGVFRDTAPGSGIGTNFGGFPYRTQAAVNSNLSETRLSPQNSRIGLRFDTKVKGTKVMAYWESDFLGSTGNPPNGNLAVSTNSYPLRLRLFFVDLKKDKWEILAGQSWSLLTPGRTGISPLPSDIFYSQVVDVNYTVGIPWGRIPELRFVYRPNKVVSMAFALDNPEQYIGGSGGSGTSVLPSGLAAITSGNELSNNTTVLNTPNVHPDLIAKIAFDGKLKNGNAVHFEVAGVERTFKTYNPGSSTVASQKFTTAGGGASANFNIELVKGLRFLTNNYYSDGGGRYLFGQAPDLVIRSDGSPSLVHSMGTVSGFEYTHKNTLVYAYYGGVYIGRNVILDTTGSKIALVGYGYSGAANSQNKSVQEGTFGFNQTLWKDAKWGALNLMGQYAYFSRNPWYLAAGLPTHAYMNEIWLNLRYTLPGAAPK